MKREDFAVHIVDSDQAIADGLATLLSTFGIEVIAYPDAEAFLNVWLPRRFVNCCLIADADLPGPGGGALLRKLHELHVNIPVLLLVSPSAPELIDPARSWSLVSIIEKPCLDQTLINRVLKIRARGTGDHSDTGRSQSGISMRHAE